MPPSYPESMWFQIQQLHCFLCVVNRNQDTLWGFWQRQKQLCVILFAPIEILTHKFTQNFNSNLLLLLLFLIHYVQIRISLMLWWFTHVYMHSLSAHGGPVAWCPVDGGPPVGTIQASELRSESELDYWLLQREYPGKTSFHILSGGLPALTDAFTGDDTQTQRWERSPDWPDPPLHYKMR